MNTNQPLLPSFLKKADKYLLLHKPETWSTRTHLVAWYGLLFIATLAALAFIIPDDPRSNSGVWAWVSFTILISIIALVVWLIFLFRFNVFKRFGNTKPIDRLATFGLYFLAVGIIVLFPFVKPAVETIRANNAYTDAELVNDVNNINIKICQLEYDSLNHKWRRDTVLVTEHPLASNRRYEEDESAITPDTTAVPAYGLSRYETMDTAEFNQKKWTEDSIEKVTDSLYVFVQCPRYTFLKPYGLSNHTGGLLDNYDIYKKVIKNFQRPNTTVVNKELQNLVNKYALHFNESNYYTSGDDDDSHLSRLKKRYETDQVEYSINNIVERKTYWDPRNLEWIIRLFYYTTLIITLLVFVFRHTTKKAFFLSLLSGVLLTIVTSLILAFANAGGYTVLFVTAVYILLFFALSLLAWRYTTQQTVTGISLNLFVLFVAILPICIVSGYYDYLETFHYNSNTFDLDYDAMKRHFFFAEIAGSVLLLLLLPTFIHAAYRKWYALPEQ